MPIKSYLAYPQDGKKDVLISELLNISYCDVIPSENEDLIIVVTETENQKQDDTLKATIEGLDSLKLLAMVSGFNTPKN
ncbi:hypothetical protein [Pseudotamlana agarivorans]|uniref:hypothetical protein n=1 Tax=Pseudotamlana agarivorans TaxID=481183 RepID=UPI00082A67C1|nr:hypothetical protein [Tamlana agarivorans]